MPTSTKAKPPAKARSKAKPPAKTDMSKLPSTAVILSFLGRIEREVKKVEPSVGDRQPIVNIFAAVKKIRQECEK